MLLRRRFVVVAALAAALHPAPAAGDGSEVAAPPPVVNTEGAWAPAAPFAGKDGVTEYSHGDPTDEEQRFLWLANRARANPELEADRVLVDYNSSRVTSAVNFFLSDRPGIEWTRQENHDAIEVQVAQPPLAFSAELIGAARYWSQVQKDENFQGHGFVGYPDFSARLAAESYSFSAGAENVYAYSDSMIHAHAGFIIDFGQPIDGGTGRPTVGHRDNTMNITDSAQKRYREVGVGVIQSPNPGQGAVGPKIVTVDFASSLDMPDRRFATGVCYVDANGNDEYDLGEGVPGVRIDVSTSTFYAITSASGGYAVPIDKNDGDVEITTTPTADPESAVIGNQAFLGSTFAIDGGGGNVMADFAPPPDPPEPGTSSFIGGGAALVDGDTVTKVFVVDDFDPGSVTVGDLDLDVIITHPDRSELTVELEAPSGTRLTLWDGPVPGADLAGSFDGTLRPAEPLSGFVGEAYEGDWKLHITDAAGAGTGMLDSCVLHVRPTWVRGVHAPRSGLFLTKLKLKDSTIAAKDSITVKAEIDAGVKLPADAATDAQLVLRNTVGERAELFRVDLAPPVVPAKADELPGAIVKLKLKLNNKETSRTLATVKVKGVDLPALPADLSVELYLGGVLVGQDVTTTNGVYSGKKTKSADQLFRVEKLASKLVGVERTTTIKGRFYGAGGQPAFQGTIEFSLGPFSESRSEAFFIQKGSQFKYAGGELVKLVIDPTAGTFTAKVVSDFDPVVDGRIAVRLRVGEFLGATEVVAVDTGKKLKY